MGCFKFGKDYHVGVRAERDHKNCYLSMRSVYKKDDVTLGATCVFNGITQQVSKFDTSFLFNMKKS